MGRAQGKVNQTALVVSRANASDVFSDVLGKKRGVRQEDEPFSSAPPALKPRRERAKKSSIPFFALSDPTRPQIAKALLAMPLGGKLSFAVAEDKRRKFYTVRFGEDQWACWDNSNSWQEDNLEYNLNLLQQVV